MNAKYSLSRHATAALVAATVLVMPNACDDNLGYQDLEGQRVAFKLSAPDTWHEGMSVNENAPTTHCTSVRALSGGDTKLYLHTVVADNPVEGKAAVTRGTPVRDKDTFTKTYSRFSLSGICYTGTYPDNESDNPWTTEYAYNLKYKTTGEAESESDRLLWPSGGKVRFFAFAPTVEDFNELNTDGSLELSAADKKGSPTLTYTVPKDVTKQVDLMTECKTVSSTTTPEVNLEFGHALTAVQIKCGAKMLAGTITEVTIGGIYGTGTQVIGSNTWETSGTATAKYTISKKITLSPAEGATDEVHVPGDTPIAGTETDNLTFMLLPQTLPDGAKMTIKFVDDATGTERTLTGSLAGQIWEAGKIVTYSVSPSSINIRAKVELNKKSATAENPGDIMPYSGVWYDATYTAKAEVVQGDDSQEIINITAPEVKFQYRFNESESWKDCTTDADGLLTIAAQPAYEEKVTKNFKTGEAGSEDNPFDLGTEKGETANCYLVDQAGYYSLPLVYGNGNLSLPENNPDGFKYFPNHNDEKINSQKISDAVDAVLCWQDAPDLIDPASVKIVDDNDDNLVFRIREHTLAQGNALLAVRNADKVILWSWHIWVTPYKDNFYDQGKFYHSTTTLKPAGYDFAQYNLGWCDPHEHNPSREFSLRAVVDMSAYGGEETTVDIGTFTQDIFKGSDAGDNTYYQWGRKDPMLGGIYNVHTPKYQYYKKYGYSGQTTDIFEFTMENKQVFNQYNQGGYNYSFCKNPGDKIDFSDPASNGVTIGYSIQHPYMFVTNSRCNDSSDENPTFNYRNHWHVPYTDKQVGYLNDETHIMFNAWDAGATAAPININDELTARDIKKSVYDPCPPKFKVPPLDAFRGIVNNKTYGSGNGNVWKLNSGQTIEFPMTGVRNYALRKNEWPTVKPLGSESDPDSNFCEEFYKTSMPAFRMLTFVSSATIVKKEVRPGEADSYTAYQVAILRIDHSNRAEINYDTIVLTPSSNSYGLPVRPIYDNRP